MSRCATQFSPPIRGINEGVIAYTGRTREARKAFDKQYIRFHGCTRDQHLEKMVPQVDPEE